MTLAELLTSQRRWGRTRARKFLIGLALNENKKLGTLTSRQRSLLAGELSSHATGERSACSSRRKSAALDFCRHNPTKVKSTAGTPGPRDLAVRPGHRPQATHLEGQAT